MDSNQSGAVGGAIQGPFQGSLTHLGASRRLRSQKYIKARPILGHILTFFDPPCQPGQIFLVKNSLYRCPLYSTTCFMFQCAAVVSVFPNTGTDKTSKATNIFYCFWQTVCFYNVWCITVQSPFGNTPQCYLLR